jgi:hypothetical protein
MDRTKVDYIPLRQVGRSLYLRVPAAFVRANGLIAGDIAVWSPGKKLKVVKQTQLEELANEAELRELCRDYDQWHRVKDHWLW